MRCWDIYLLISYIHTYSETVYTVHSYNTFASAKVIKLDFDKSIYRDKYSVSWDRLGNKTDAASGCATMRKIAARFPDYAARRWEREGGGGRLHDYCAARWERGGLTALAGFKYCAAGKLSGRLKKRHGWIE